MTSVDSAPSIIDSARTFLFVPGDRPDRFDKARDSGADIVVIDLEDAVTSSAKSRSRAVVAAWLTPEKPVMVRINGWGTPWFEDDLALARIPGVLGVMLPKAEPIPATARVAQGVPTVALIESANGIAGLSQLVQAQFGVRRLALGALDLSLDLAITAGTEALDPIRLQMVIASRVAGLPPPIEGITVEIDDISAVEQDTRRAQSLGFSGKLAIHPRQLKPILAALRPSEDQIRRARIIVEVDQASGGAAVTIDGQMVDRPVVERARRLLATQRRSDDDP
jgi:citrate lyase subunit beta / citryl-CoA lyase